jgi:L-methionine (R)-S-oxide reductase
VTNSGKAQSYADLVEQLTALLDGEPDPVANAANTAALLMHMLPELNWAGFYFLRERHELVLGPFQGKPACVRIAAGHGGNPCSSRTSTPSPAISPATLRPDRSSWCR